MDATCAIQASIHVFSLVRKYVSRILGTYQWCWAFSDYSDFQRVKQCAVFTTPDFSTAFLLPHSQFTQQLNQSAAAHP